jgi:hypothetical protein
MRMTNTKKTLLLIFSILALGAKGAGTTTPASNLELIKSDSMDVNINMGKQTDNSRIYLDEGAIWASRDVNRIEPQLKVSINDEAVVSGGKLENKMNFNVKTNYGYYIERWELSVYRGDDINLMSPIKIISGKSLHNNQDIVWDGNLDETYELRAGRQLMFRLKAWDHEGNLDVTTTGIVDLVKAKSEFTLEAFEEDNENKRTFGQAKLMRHNIPVNSGMAKFIGTNLVGVEKVIIGTEEYTIKDESLFAEEYLPTDRYFIPVKVIYDDGREKEYEIYVEIPEKYFVQTGIADLYIGRNYVSKNEAVLAVDDEYDGDLYDRGRLAYFGMGKFSDSLRVTAQMDTREDNLEDMFKDMFKSDSDSIFESIEDDDNYYPTYGDDASITREVNTQGKLYLKIEYDKSDYLWGNYNTGLTATEFSQYNRSLYGAKGDYKTNSTTSYGEDRLNVVGFVSEPSTLSSHDEFLGTGGSLYFLQHGDVTDGSEKVAVELVDKTSRITKDIVYLQEGRDYEINNYQGRIILTRPLSDISSDSFGSIINDDVRDGYENYLTVDYEYTPDDSDSLDYMTMGGRAKGWVNDYVGIGSTYVIEEQDNYDYEMEGVDLTLRASEGTYLITEYSRSQGTQIDSNFLSLDGGLNFEKISNTSRDDKTGDAFRVSGVISLYDINQKIFSPYGNDVSVWYQNKDLEYSYASQDDDLSWESYGTEIRLRPSNKFQIKAGYSYTEEIDETDDVITDSKEIQVQGEYAVTDKLTLGIEAKHIQELDDGNLGKGDLLGVRAEYEIVDGTKVYAEVQETIHSNAYYEENDLYTLGGETRINDRLKLSGEGSTGDRGYSADATLDFSVKDDYDVYVGYVLENEDGSDNNNIVFGQRAKLTDKVDIYQENQFVYDNDGHGRTDSYGFDYERTEDHKVGMSFQTGTDEDDDKRKAVSVYQTIGLPRSTVRNKFEYRLDSGDEKIHQYVTTNSFKYKWTNEYTVTGKINYSVTENDTTGKTESEYSEGNIGLAYRPIYNDKVNYLTRYTYLQDEEIDSDRDISYVDENSHIVEFETLYDYDENWAFGLKLAFKDKKETYERESGEYNTIRSKIYLVGVKSTYHILHKWDLFTEYHWKVDDYEEDLEQGAIVALNRHIGENFKLGVGYNFSKFNDNLKKDDYNANGWFINLVGKF